MDRAANIIQESAANEKAVFQPTIDICLPRKNGYIVIDDELIVSRAQDVERKQNSQGPSQS